MRITHDHAPIRSFTLREKNKNVLRFGVGSSRLLPGYEM